MPEFEYRKQKEREYQQKTEELLSTLPRFCSTYVNGIEGYTGPLTIYTYIHRISIFFRYGLESNLFDKDDIRRMDFSDLDSITLIDIEDFTHWLRGGNASSGERLKESSINNYLSAMNSLWDYAQTRGFIKHNIIKDIKRAKKFKKDVVALDREQSVRMEKEIENGYKTTKHQDAYRSVVSITRDKAIYLMLLHTGLRVSELVGIDMDDINMDKNYVRVFRKENKIMNVYFSDAAKEALDDYIRERKTILTDKSEKALFLVTLGKYQGKRLSVRSVENLIKKYADSSIPELSGDVHVHSLRASYASQMIAATGDLSLVQQLMAHENPATTAIYIADRSAEMESHRNDLDQ